MQIGRIARATRVLGKSQGYLGLPVRDEVVSCSVGGEMPSMVTAWIPTPDEIERIVAGASIHVRLIGTAHPPIMLDVGDVPDDRA